jgi:hypothetical protein
MWRQTQGFVHPDEGRKSLILSTCTVGFPPCMGYASPPLPFVAYTPPQPGESCKATRKYNHFQRIVVFCSKTAGTP